MLAASELQQPVTKFCSREFPAVDISLTVGQALESVRARGMRDKIIYFYVTDADGVLRGVLPTRRLLTEPLERPVAECMIPRVVAIPETATLLEACELFVLHKFLAFPVIDSERRIVGVVDVNVFTGEVLDHAERNKTEDFFQSLGFRVAEIASASPVRAFQLRFPWLLATIAGGTACALLSGFFAQTLAEQLVLAFFLTLVLGLGESVAAQSLAVTLQSMHEKKPTLAGLAKSLRKEFFTAVLLGACSALLVGTVVVAWRGDALAAGCIASSVLASMVVACLLGVMVPTVSRAMRLDPKIAAGPLTLALADICTLSLYFGTATLVLG
jgi:magnesium transporter